ncbi:autotransporter outer membrane beta-barrel domain-containing protein [Gilliamella sp. B3825]|uniref:autotransporter outer membrane beta-barrel domain-containing protein n=10 Tax=Gilliamella TaxID=1193503 RepID=UPI00226A1733|nr:MULTISPECIES: autotransporter outer membrane beta-barrel domain-containing protein [unclassified Gilliamella]MCX8577279.1 autotransporter outer membrane beta-barrel domain-containing protein [Gilliamella sp. B3815]MCX8590205.1 autotransporter outer membrane beta-barrel domain-containing protein [Gilliamella sp. B3812]MCX8604978.1 autotransporter outer membrane beta-barrel domain-containing protein [Gilliamella sp. B3825]
MNKIYKVLKNRQGISLAVSELAKGKTKSSVSKIAAAIMITAAMSESALAAPIHINSNETIKGNGTGTIQSGQITNEEYSLGSGTNGKGRLTISDGGTLSLARILVGRGAGNSGELILDNGHLINAQGVAYFGFQGGDANVLITNGGTFTNTAWASPSIGSEAGSNTTLTVKGKGSAFIQKSKIQVFVGANGNAKVDVIEGGLFDAKNTLLLGFANGTAIFNVIGKDSTLNAATMRIGPEKNVNTGHAELNILNGAKANIGDTVNGTLVVRNGGKVFVDGTDSALNVVKDISIGNKSEITVSNDAKINTTKNANGENDGITINEGGKLNVGGKPNEAPQKAGAIDVPVIHFANQDPSLPAGELNFNHTNNDYQVGWDIDSKANGKGNVNVISGDNFISGKHTYEGNTNITGGSWNAKAENVFSEKSNYNVDKKGSLNLEDHNQTIGNLVNGGTIDLGKDSANTVLTVNGDYRGEDGKLNMYVDTEKGESDKLVVKGNTSGKTNIDITEIGRGNSERGKINLVDVVGQDDAIWNIIEKKDSEFDYTIGRDENGKLVIEYTNAFSNVYKSPIVASVFGNQLAALNMFRHSAHDRDTSIYVPDSNVWMRYSYDRTQTDMFNGRQSIDMKTSVIEMGVDVLSLDQFKVGVYGGYGHSSIDTQQKHSKRNGDGSVSGYNLGVYGNWNAQTNGEGLYVDTWAQYSWFKHKTSVHLSNSRNYSSKYNGNALSLSAEVGYGLIVLEGDEKNWLLEPHAQIGYTWLDSDKFNLGRAGKVDNINADGAQLRLGARYYGQSTKSGYGVLPFIEANWLYDSSSPEAKVKGKHVDSNQGKNYAEFKVGVSGSMTKSLSAYAQLDTRFGSDKYSRIGGQLGLNYSF